MDLQRCRSLTMYQEKREVSEESPQPRKTREERYIVINFTATISTWMTAKAGIVGSSHGKGRKS
jgi:hypothetical protein